MQLQLRRFAASAIFLQAQLQLLFNSQQSSCIQYFHIKWENGRNFRLKIRQTSFYNIVQACAYMNLFISTPEVSLDKIQFNFMKFSSEEKDKEKSIYSLKDYLNIKGLWFQPSESKLTSFI